MKLFVFTRARTMSPLTLALMDGAHTAEEWLAAGFGPAATLEDARLASPCL